MTRADERICSSHRAGRRAVLVSFVLHGVVVLSTIGGTQVVLADAGWRGSEESAHVEITVRIAAQSAPIVPAPAEVRDVAPPPLPPVELELPAADRAPFLAEPVLAVPDAATLPPPPPPETDDRRFDRLAVRVPAPAVPPAEEAVATPPVEPASAVASTGAAFVAASELAGANPAPYYLPSEREAGHEGTVVLSIDVDAEGAVAAIAVVQSSGWRKLDREALRCLRTWHFTPARQHGVAVPCTIEKRVQFKIVQN